MGQKCYGCQSKFSLLVFQVGPLLLKNPPLQPSSLEKFRVIVFSHDSDFVPLEHTSNRTARCPNLFRIEGYKCHHRLVPFAGRDHSHSNVNGGPVSRRDGFRIVDSSYYMPLGFWSPRWENQSIIYKRSLFT